MKPYIERKVMKIFFKIFIFYITGCSIVYASEKPEIFAQLGHSGVITSIIFSPDGRYIASGSHDKTLKLWDSSTGREIRTFVGHSEAINTIAFSPDGKYIASGSEDKTIKFWDVSTNREIRSFTGHKDWITSLAFSPDGKYFVSGSYDKTIKIWEISTGNEMKILKGHESFVNDVNFSPDGKHIVSGSSDKTIKLWEVSTGREIRTFKGHTHLVVCVLFCPDGKYIVSGSEDKTIKFWDVSTGNEIKTLKGHTAGVNSVSFGPDGKHIISGSSDKTIKLWEVSTGREISTFKGHSGSITSIIFSPDGRYIVSGSHDKTLKLWDVSTGNEIKTLKGHTAGVNSVSFSPDGRYIVSGSVGSTINLWDTLTGKEIRTFKGHSDQIKAVTFSPDGKFISSGGDDKTARIWQLSTGKEMRIFKGHTKYINSIAFSPDGKYLVSGGDEIIKLWDVTRGNEVKAITGYKGNIISLTFSPDGKYIASGGIASKDFKLKLWEVSTGNEVRAFREDYGVRSVIFSPNGKLICSAGQIGALKLWDATTGKEIRKFVGHTGWVFSASFSSDGNNIASGSDDKTIKLWDALTGKEIMTFKGCLDRVHSVAFAPNNRYITSGSRDGTTRLWDASTGKELAKFISFTDGEWVVITPEGYYNSSLNGHKYLNIRLGNNVYGIDQFYDVFYRPDILTAKLRGENITSLITLTIDEAIKNPPPDVLFTSVPADTDAPKVDICYQAKNSGGGIGEVRLFHNGKLIQSDGFYKDIATTIKRKINLSSLNSESIREDMRSIVLKTKKDISPITSKEKGVIFTNCVAIDAVPGVNEVSVSAFNKENTVQSYMRTTSFKANIEVKDSRLYMLVIGIDQYRDQSVNLKYAAKDARNISDKLHSQSVSLFKSENIHSIVLTDKEATKVNIQNKITEMANSIKPTDGFILYVAGHGVLLHNQYFVLTHDYDGTINDKSMVSSNEIIEASKKIKSLSQLFIFDTCHAGGVDYIISGLYDARMSVLAKKMGLHIYASANDKQAAMDGYKGNGLFTYTLLDGLNNNKEADRNKDGKITIVGLGEYSKKMTTNISKQIGHEQTPLIINFGKDSPIYKLQ